MAVASFNEARRANRDEVEQAIVGNARQRLTVYNDSKQSILEEQQLCENLTPEQRKELGVPETLIQLDEIADTILRLATDESLFGRIMVWWNGEPPRLIPVDDPGYQRLE